MIWRRVLIQAFTLFLPLGIGMAGNAGAATNNQILWRNSSGDVDLWVMNGGTIGSATDLGVIPSSWTIQGRGDFNGDGKPDILWRNANGDVVIWFMNGGVISSSVDLGVVSASWTIQGTGDFNADGKTDILWRNSNGDVVIWFMNGSSIASSSDLGVIPTTWSVQGTGDFNGDTKADVLWRNTNGDVVIWFMNGGKIASSADLGVIASSWSVQGTGDFNGDAKSDILWRNTNGDAVIWFMNGGSIASSADLGVVPTSWTIEGTGDFNGDSKADIAWRNANGDVVVWLMNSGSILSSSNLGVIPAAWTVSTVGVMASPQAPSGLSYTAQAPLLLGNSVSLAPTITGMVTGYGVSPALPAGLTLNTTTGVISGIPTAVTPAATYTITAANASGSTSFGVALSVQTGPTVQLTVAASGQPGDMLFYRWKSTDGVIQNVNAPVTTWTAPSGPGNHFIYVLVANGKGGYSEGQFTVNTDSIGAAGLPYTGVPGNYSAPAATAPIGVPMRFFVYNAPFIPPPAPLVAVHVSTPNTAVQLSEYNGGYISDGKGMVVFQNVPLNGHALSTTCDFGLAFYNSSLGYRGCYSFLYQTFTALSTSASYYDSQIIGLNLSDGLVPVVGSVRQADGNLPGVTEPFFDINTQAGVILQSATCMQNGDCGQATVNNYGDFAVPVYDAGPISSPLTLSVTVEASAATTLSIAGTQSTIQEGLWLTSPQSPLILTGVTSPTIAAMSGTSNGVSLANTFQLIWPRSSGQPSDAFPQQDHFLAFKGSDSRLGSCLYYQAIGAVPLGGCDQFSDDYSGAINFEDWKSAVRIDKYAGAGAVVATATYVNAVDLNLTREHHSVAYPQSAYGTNSYPVAAYVCNHPGPVDGNNHPTSSQAVVDSAITVATTPTAVSAAANRALVACVAMDYIRSNANGGAPFTRFLVFGPSGKLLPSVNLDGRGEKFLPGACIACHGGDTYAGKFSEDVDVNGVPVGNANVGAHFLPYDPGNFLYSSAANLTYAAQKQGIYQLNQNILGTNPTAATLGLIAGLYPGAGPGASNTPPSYTPVPWDLIHTSATNNTMYTQVVAKSCRTCHAALPVWNFDSGPDSLLPYSIPPCGGNQDKLINHAMPNSLVTFNQLWSSAAQISALASFFPAGCALATLP